MRLDGRPLSQSSRSAGVTPKVHPRGSIHRRRKWLFELAPVSHPEQNGKQTPTTTNTVGPPPAPEMGEIVYPEFEQIVVYQPTDTGAWDQMVETCSHQTTRMQRSLWSRSHRGNVTEVTMDAIVLLYIAPCNPLTLFELAALRHARNAVGAVHGATVIGTMVLPYNDAMLQASQPKERRLVFSQRVMLTRLIISNVKEESRIFVDIGLEGSLKGCSPDRIIGAMATYAKNLVRSSRVVPKVIQVLLEDPVYRHAKGRHLCLMVGAPLQGAAQLDVLRGPVGEVVAKVDLVSEESAAVRRLSAILTSTNFAKPAPDVADSFISEETRKALDAFFQKLADVLDTARRSKFATVDKVVVDMLKWSQLEALLKDAVRQPRDFSYFQVLERMCGTEVATQIKNIDKQNRRNRTKMMESKWIADHSHSHSMM